MSNSESATTAPLSTGTVCPLLSLSPDALRCVLCRVPARDHDSLRRSCKEVRAAVDSATFRKARSLSGWAEVDVTLPTREKLLEKERARRKEMREAERKWRRRMRAEKRAEENGIGDGEKGVGERDSVPLVGQDDADASESEEDSEDDNDDDEEMYGEIGFRDQSYEYEDATATVWVDGKKGGEAEIVVVPRGSRWFGEFHEATDAHSSDLQSIGWSYADDRGRVKLRSIQSGGGPACSTGGFLYIRTFKVEPEYRSSSGGTTNVGAAAVRALMTHSRLKGKWTLAAYISDPWSHYSYEDEELSRKISDYDHEILHVRVPVAPTKEERRANSRCRKEYCVLDILPFLRAGFRQVPEMVKDPGGNPYHCYAVPFFFDASHAEDSGDNNSQAGGARAQEVIMMSHEEALAIPIVHPPELPLAPGGVDRELFEMVKKACREQRSARDSKYVHPPDLQLIIQRVDTQINQTELALQTMVVQALEGVDASQRAEVERSIQERMEPILQGTRQLVTDLHIYMRESEDRHHAAIRERLGRIDSRVRDESSHLVQKGGASIEDSHVLHCAAVYLLRDYLHVFMDLVPPADRKRAINKLDDNGITPLMCATGTVLSLDEARDRLQPLCEELLRLGAEKDIVSPVDGLTALGHYRKMIMNHQTRHSSILDRHRVPEDLNTDIEDLLMPTNGATPADDAVMRIDQHNEPSEEGDMDVDLNEDSDHSEMDGDDESDEEGSDIGEDMDDNNIRQDAGDA